MILLLLFAWCLLFCSTVVPNHKPPKYTDLTPTTNHNHSSCTSNINLNHSLEDIIFIDLHKSLLHWAVCQQYGSVSVDVLHRHTPTAAAHRCMGSTIVVVHRHKLVVVALSTSACQHYFGTAALDGRSNTTQLSTFETKGHYRWRMHSSWQYQGDNTAGGTYRYNRTWTYEQILHWYILQSWWQWGRKVDHFEVRSVMMIQKFWFYFIFVLPMPRNFTQNRTLGFLSIAICWQKMERYAVGSSSKGAAAGETYFVWWMQRHYIGCCEIYWLSSFISTCLCHRKYPFRLINILDAYLWRKQLQPTNLMVRYQCDATKFMTRITIRATTTVVQRIWQSTISCMQRSSVVARS